LNGKKISPTEQRLRALLAEQNSREAELINRFVSAATSGDVAGFETAMHELWDGGILLQQAFRAVGRLQRVAPAIRAYFLQKWISDGDSIRNEMREDRFLLPALRMLLPPYNGPAVRLYRGDSAFNRRRRTYGMSWSARRDVAEGFALGIWRRFRGGSVLLETLAPAEAIICVPHLHDDTFEEAEYLVDRRRLSSVKILARFAEDHSPPPTERPAV
jgi:hypothetical protein